MQVHHERHMTWISALTHFAFGCTAGQGHTAVEELLQQDMMVLWEVLDHAVYKEFHWTPVPRQPRHLHSGQFSEEEKQLVVPTFTEGKRWQTPTEHRLSAQSLQGETKSSNTGLECRNSQYFVCQMILYVALMEKLDYSWHLCYCLTKYN